VKQTERLLAFQILSSAELFRILQI
jgi:hypothetical protein